MTLKSRSFVTTVSNYSKFDAKILKNNLNSNPDHSKYFILITQRPSKQFFHQPLKVLMPGRATKLWGSTTALSGLYGDCSETSCSCK